MRHRPVGNLAVDRVEVVLGHQKGVVLRVNWFIGRHVGEVEAQPMLEGHDEEMAERHRVR